MMNQYATINLDDRFAQFCANGDLPTIKKLVSEGANIFYNNNVGLRWAASKGHLDVVKYLVENGADIHVNKDGPFMLSCLGGHFDVMMYLVERGADIEGAGSNSQNYIISEVTAKNFEVVKFAVSNRTKILVDQEKALIAACEESDFERVKFFVESGADIHYNNETALSIAGLNASLEIFKYLIDNGADLNHDRDQLVKLIVSDGYFGLEKIKYLVTEHNIPTDLIISFKVYPYNKEIKEWCQKYGESKELKDKLNNSLSVSDVTNKRKKI